MAEQGFYVGIDIDDTYAVVSFYEDGMKEPATVSMKPLTEVFQVPLQIGRKKKDGQWFIGEEVTDTAMSADMTVVDHLLSRAKNSEELVIEGECYQAVELLSSFLKKLTGYISGPYGTVLIKGLAFSVEKLNEQIITLLWSVGEALGVRKEQILLLDRKSAFYYFALTQPRELWLQEVCLFDYKKDGMRSLRLARKANTVPQMISIEEQYFEINADRRDEDFYQVLEQIFDKRIVSSVYLVGDGFDGGWMKQSLNYMCRGRRAFMGKNLYAKGACYALMVVKGGIQWPYVYIGDNEMKVNVSLAVRNRGRKEFLTLISAGDNWYEVSGECDVILDDTKEIAIWLLAPDSKTANVEKLTLSDLPERENRTTRLHIVVKPLSDRQVKIEMKDMGFGELVKAKDKYWEYVMSV